MTQPPATDSSSPSAPPRSSGSGWPSTIAAALLCWMAMAAGFLGLQLLLRDRPQFAGQPVRFSSQELLQAAPRIVYRRVGEDVSEWRSISPEKSVARFNLAGREDYRGLRTLIDMTAEFEGRCSIRNPHPEPIFVLVKWPRPVSRHGSSELRIKRWRGSASAEGLEKNTTTDWYWTGQIEPEAAVELEVDYQAPGLASVRYEATGEEGVSWKNHRTEMNVDAIPSLAFESGDGPVSPGENGNVEWVRDEAMGPDFFSARILHTRHLYSALHQLLQIGPLVSFLFMATLVAVLLSRGSVSFLQLVTLSAGFSFYFPLVMYLSTQFSFAVALILSVVIPGLLVLNYARWVLGFWVGVVGGGLFLALYQVFPTLAAFAGWKRGMVLLCLGVVTLSVLIHLQNRTLKRAALAAILLTFGLGQPRLRAENEIQVIVPRALVKTMEAERADRDLPRFSAGLAQYDARLDSRFLEVQAELPIVVHRSGTGPVAPFSAPIYILESEHPPFVRPQVQDGLLAWEMTEPGEGLIRVLYRAPVVVAGDRASVTLPMMAVPSGRLSLAGAPEGIEVQGGSLWEETGTAAEKTYQIGVAGPGPLRLSWPSVPDGTSTEGSTSGIPGAPGSAVYGLQILESQQLTVIHTDGARTHFAHYRLPAYHKNFFETRLPEKARVVSVAVNGAERTIPETRENRCRIPLFSEGSAPSLIELTLRLALEPAPLGFIGFMDLTLPDPDSTVGRLRWHIIFPDSFQLRTLSSGLSDQGIEFNPEVFGDYGHALKSLTVISLGKSLASPGPVTARFKYHQEVMGLATHPLDLSLE